MGSTNFSFCCEQCNYKTNKEYNLTRHCKLKHDTTKTYFSCQYCDNEYTTLASLKRHEKDYCNYKPEHCSTNSLNIAPNVNHVVELSKKHCCEFCKKEFIRKSFLKKHQDEGRCKGVSTSTECPNCHKQFNNRQAKLKHFKTCIVKQEVSDQQKHYTTNNTTNITDSTVTNIQTQNNTVNNVHIQGDIIIYNDKTLMFNDDHIGKRDLQRIFHGASVKTIQAIASYALKILENPQNRCVKKKHITSSYCEVHSGDGIWICRPDKTVVERFSQDVASSANDKLYDHPDIGDQKIREEITNIASFDEEVEKNRELVKELRSVLVQVSRETNQIEQKKSV